MNIKEIKCKGVLTKSKLPEVDYCINPYVGCMHKCVYCYARFMKRFTGHEEEWGAFVDVKINAAEILKKELSGKNQHKGTVLLGSVTDAYQPIERKYGITRDLLRVLSNHDFPISILTKSDLVTRDVDILKQFTDCEVGLTITSLDEKASRIIEPLSSSPRRRIEALKYLHDSGIRTYAFIGPILPGITDLRGIFEELKGKVDFLMAESLNSQCGNWDEVIEVIGKVSPENVQTYRSKFSPEYWDKIEDEVRSLCAEFQIPLKGFYRHK